MDSNSRSPVSGDTPRRRDPTICNHPTRLQSISQLPLDFRSEPWRSASACGGQHAFEKRAVSNYAGVGDARGKSMRDFTLEHRFPSWHKAVIDPQIRSKERAFGCFAKVFKRTKLDFQFTRFRNSCIGTVERAIGLCSAAPTGKEKRGRQRSDAPHPPHGVGRNTQIAAGSFDAARTATKSRSSSGTKSAVRAPDTVGTRAIS